MDFLEVKPSDLSPLKLSLVSFGSIGGIGVGLLISMIITSTLFKVIIAISFLALSLYLILKNLKLLLW